MPNVRRDSRVVDVDHISWVMDTQSSPVCCLAVLVTYQMLLIQRAEGPENRNDILDALASGGSPSSTKNRAVSEAVDIMAAYHRGMINLFRVHSSIRNGRSGLRCPCLQSLRTTTTVLASCGEGNLHPSTCETSMAWPASTI